LTIVVLAALVDDLLLQLHFSSWETRMRGRRS